MLPCIVSRRLLGEPHVSDSPKRPNECRVGVCRAAEPSLKDDTRNTGTSQEE